MVRTAICSLLLSILAIAVGTSGCGHTPATEKQGDGKDTIVQPVVASKPQSKTLTLTTTQPGRIEAFEETPLYAKTAGYVAEVLVDIGDVVQKGNDIRPLDVCDRDVSPSRQNVLFQLPFVSPPRLFLDHRMAKEGVDPAAAKTQSRAARTVGEFAEEYLTK